MKIILFATIAVISFLRKQAQSLPPAMIKVSILTEGGKPLEGATVELFTAKNTVLVKTALTDKSGLAELDTMQKRMFLIKSNFVNHSPRYKQQFEVKAGSVITVPSITLVVASAAMQDVTVTAKKPFIQKLTDRIKHYHFIASEKKSKNIFKFFRLFLPTVILIIELRNWH